MKLQAEAGLAQRLPRLFLAFRALCCLSLSLSHSASVNQRHLFLLNRLVFFLLWILLPSLLVLLDTCCSRTRSQQSIAAQASRQLSAESIRPDPEFLIIRTSIHHCCKPVGLCTSVFGGHPSSPSFSAIRRTVYCGLGQRRELLSPHVTLNAWTRDNGRSIDDTPLFLVTHLFYLPNMASTGALNVTEAAVAAQPAMGGAQFASHTWMEPIVCPT